MLTSRTANQRRITASCRMSKRFFDAIVRCCNRDIHQNLANPLLDCLRLSSEMFDDVNDRSTRDVCETECTSEGELH